MADRLCAEYQAYNYYCAVSLCLTYLAMFYFASFSLFCFFIVAAFDGE